MNDTREAQAPRWPQRRVVLQAGGGLLVGTLVLPLTGCGESGRLASDLGGPLRGPDRPTPFAFFLTPEERRTLRALVDRLIPGEDGPGAVAAECDVAIDAMLGAFLTDPPLIYAGGPFSDRGGAQRNDFARFIPLDAYEELAWRLVIEGSQGRPEREFNGPVKGRQQIYREGLAHLDDRAAQIRPGASGFAALSAAERDAILFDARDSQTQALVDVAFPDTLNAFYGAPEYGGNKDLVGWTSMNFDGDTQPRGYTDAQVIHADNPGLLDFLLPPSFGGDPEGPRPAPDAPAAAKATPAAVRVSQLKGMVSPESLAAVIASADGSLARLKAQMAARVQHPAVLIWERDHA